MKRWRIHAPAALRQSFDLALVRKEVGPAASRRSGSGGMRVAPIPPFSFAAVVACLIAGCLQITPTGGGTNTTSGTASDGGSDAYAETATRPAGAGCGIESGSGTQLCTATSLCPDVVVDTQALPHCGFRIRAGASELICACGDQICSMGAFTTCAQAATLLTSQTEQQVCNQVAEGRCSAAVPAAGSSGSSGSSGSPTCDHQCLSECGSGAGCASICGC